jgi:TolA-binding protein
VANQKGTGADYAMFQIGYAQGLLRRYQDKSATMEQLVATYPKSDYADDALYEIARANLQDGNESKAVNAYTRLISDYPNSSYARKASLERAMVYRDAKQYDEAIAGFKATIEQYAGSEEAYAAMDGLEQIYVETNNITEYLAYAKQTGRMKSGASAEEDSLTYVTAELQYMLGHYKEAAAGMTTYISRFCSGGRYCTMATYQAADSYYRLGKPNEAIELYTTLMDTPGNPYMEESCTRLAELLYEKKSYEQARKYFVKLRELTTEQEKKNTADLGELRCSYFLKDSKNTIEVANRMLEKTGLNDNVRDEALYNRGQVYYAQGEYGKAAADFAILSQNVRVVTGAESAYLLADCYYRLNDLDKSENEIMAFAGKKTQHQYWLAKSLILLSDINVSRGDLFQAKQYLLSLQTNYKAYNDDIQQTIIERLDAIQKQEDNETSVDTNIPDADNNDNEEE